MNPNIPIAAIMTLNPTVIRTHTKIEKIKRIFNSNDFHHLPVVEEGRTIVGMVSKTDLLCYEEGLKKDFWKTLEKGAQAKHIMASNLTILDPSDTIGLAADIFMSNIFHSIPIVEDGKLVGIITSHDVIKFAFKGVILGEEFSPKNSN